MREGGKLLSQETLASDIDCPVLHFDSKRILDSLSFFYSARP